MPSQVALRQLGNFHQRAEQADLQWAVAMHRNHDPLAPPAHCENVMTPVNPGQTPAFPLDRLPQILA